MSEYERMVRNAAIHGFRKAVICVAIGMASILGSYYWSPIRWVFSGVIFIVCILIAHEEVDSARKNWIWANKQRVLDQEQEVRKILDQ